jgi:hypothetical protein
LVVPLCLILLARASVAEAHLDKASKSAGQNTIDLHEHPFQGKKQIEVSVGLYISNLAVVEETREQFEVEGYFTVEWDDPRLALPEKSRVAGHLRKLNPDDLWTPPLETANMISHRRNSFELTVDDPVISVMSSAPTLLFPPTTRCANFPSTRRLLNFRSNLSCRPLRNSLSPAVRPAQPATIRRPMRDWRPGRSKA